MKIISFGFTAPAIVAREKTVTRRDWTDSYASRFKSGEVVQAWSKQPRFGGVKIAEIRLTQAPYRQHLTRMRNSDYEAEGFHYLDEIGHKPPPSSGFHDFSWREFCRWRKEGGIVWVVRFRIVRVEEGALDAIATDA